MYLITTTLSIAVLLLCIDPFTTYIRSSTENNHSLCDCVFVLNGIL